MTQTLKRVAVAGIGFLLLFPFLVGLVHWLSAQWQTYVVGLGVSACCYYVTRRGRGAPLHTGRIGSAERLPVDPGASMASRDG